MRFRAWYATATPRGWRYDGLVIDGLGVDDFKALPESGVLWIAYYPSTHRGRTHFSGGDWYYLTAGSGLPIGYVPSLEWGREEPRPDIECRDCVKRGVAVSDPDFARVEAEASSYWPGEVAA